jgi:hypothetical protein
MGVPREFILGGMSYAGTNVSMRMLENSFLGYILRHKSLFTWVMREIGSFLRWPVANGRFKPFKMADDLQRKAFDLQLNQAGKLSDTTLLAGSDYDQEEENKIMIKETATRIEAQKRQQLAMAEVQGQQQMIMNKYQVKAQQAAQNAMQAPAAAGEPGGPGDSGAGTPGGQQAADPSQQTPGEAPGTQQAAQAQQQQKQATQPSPMQAMQSPLSSSQKMPPGAAGGMDIQALAYMQAQSIQQMPEDQQQTAIANLRAQSSELADLVEQIIRAGSGGEKKDQNPIDMRPMPDKLPPRRDAALV